MREYCCICGKSHIKPFVAPEEAARESDPLPHVMSLESVLAGAETSLKMKKKVQSWKEVSYPDLRSSLG